MIRQILFLITIALLVSCGSGKSSAGNSGTAYKKNSTRVVKSAKRGNGKPVATRKTPVRAVAKTPAQKKIQEQYEGAKEEGKSTPGETVYSKSEILEATTRVKVTTAMVLDYINQYKDIAKSNMQQYGIPASIILGQGILESGAGTGPLSTLANNHFGIKCHKEWTGPSVKYDDDEAQECFRKYEQSGESYKDHSLFLTSRPRYASLFELDNDDYKAWAKGLKAAGYATDNKYPEKLIGIIERYQLHKYDIEVLGKDYEPNKPINISEVVTSDSDMYQVNKGDTLYSISKRFNMSVEDLRKKNNISDNSISIGQNLIIR
ncbi:MAG TPA: glucosaminidase domain-containing protein [Flavobacterium sp.]|jgi:flagellum-specific peptidoglycan hydrolase FlgJ